MTSRQKKWIAGAGVVFAVFLAGLLLYVAWPLRTVRPLALTLVAAATGVGVALAYRHFAGQARRRIRLEFPFPEAWRGILEERVVWYRRLEPDDRERFERSVQGFLSEKRVTGVETDIDDEVRLLVAASAMIPVFGYPDWHYANLEEVLIYPRPFSDNYELEGPDADLLGLMGEEELSRVVLLSKPDLLAGFRRAEMRPNPGIHEFVHRFDAADGTLDGIPALGEPDPDGWLYLIDREIDRIERGQSRLDPYAATDDVEFLAVAAETFFMRPELLRLDHSELYQRLVRIFRQDPLAQERRLTPRRKPSSYAFRPKRRGGKTREKDEPE